MTIIRHKPYDRTTHDGDVVNWRTKAMILESEERLGYNLTVVQGSYNPGGVGASGGTHDGGGALDLTPADWQNKVRVLRRVGFAAWHRPELWINGVKEWGEHIHAIAIGDKQMSDSAARQVQQYHNHTDGLAGAAHDDFPYHPNNVLFDYAAWQKERILNTRLARLFRKRETINDNVAELRAELRKIRH